MADILHYNSEGGTFADIRVSQYITERTPEQEEGVRFLEGRQKKAKLPSNVKFSHAIQ